MWFDRICNENGIRHLLTAPYPPTTTGKVERLHKTMRREFFDTAQRKFATVQELQAGLDEWVNEYNTERPHQSVGMCPPLERFQLRQGTPVAADPVVQVPKPRRGSGERSPGVTRWVDQRGGISLAGFRYRVGPVFAGELVEVVCEAGLVQVLHALGCGSLT